MAVVKNLSKSGEHYWVITDFDIKRDRNGNKSYNQYIDELIKQKGITKFLFKKMKSLFK